MFIQILTTISSCKSNSSESQIEPELILTPYPLLPEIKQRFFKLCRLNGVEIEDIRASVFKTVLFKKKKFVNTKGSFLYFGVKHLLVSKTDPQIVLKMGKKGVSNNSELQMCFNNAKVKNRFLQEILSSKKNCGDVFASVSANTFDKFFVLGFYETLSDNNPITKISDIIRNTEELKTLILYKIPEAMDKLYQSILIYKEGENENTGNDIRSEIKDILKSLIDSKEECIVELFELNGNNWIVNSAKKDAINSEILKKLSENHDVKNKLIYNVYTNGLDDINKNETDDKNKSKESSTNTVFGMFSYFNNISTNEELLNSLGPILNDCLKIINFAKEFKALIGFLKSCENKGATKQKFEEYKIILSNLSQDTQTKAVIEAHIRLITSLIRPSDEQTRIFNILNDQSVAYNLSITFKGLNGQKSVVSKYYTVEDETLEVIEELPLPVPKMPPVQYTGLLNNPWFYIGLFAAFVVLRGILIYSMNRGRYTTP